MSSLDGRRLRAVADVTGGDVGPQTPNCSRTAAPRRAAASRASRSCRTAACACTRPGRGTRDSANRATRLVAGVYANANGHPGGLLTQATLTAVTSGAWNAIAVPKAAIASGTTYWIAVLSPSSRGTLQFGDRFGGGRSETSSQATLSTLPQTWTTGQTWPDGPLSAIGGT